MGEVEERTMASGWKRERANVQGHEQRVGGVSSFHFTVFGRQYILGGSKLRNHESGRARGTGYEDGADMVKSPSRSGLHCRTERVREGQGCSGCGGSVRASV